MIIENELDILLDEAEKALMTCMIDKKGFAKIGFILTQIRERKTMVIHTELLYNFLAVQVIRQDEQAEHFNNAIHLEKIERLFSLLVNIEDDERVPGPFPANPEKNQEHDSQTDNE